MLLSNSSVTILLAQDIEPRLYSNPLWCILKIKLVWSHKIFLFLWFFFQFFPSAILGQYEDNNFFVARECTSNANLPDGDSNLLPVFQPIAVELCNWHCKGICFDYIRRSLFLFHWHLETMVPKKKFMAQDFAQGLFFYKAQNVPVIVPAF